MKNPLFERQPWGNEKASHRLGENIWIYLIKHLYTACIKNLYILVIRKESVKIGKRFEQILHKGMYTNGH